MSDLLAKLTLCRANIVAELSADDSIPLPIERLAREAVASIDAVLNVSRLYYDLQDARPILSQGDGAALQS